MSGSYFPRYKLLNLQKFLNPKQTKKLSDIYHSTISRFIETYEPWGPIVKSIQGGIGVNTSEMIQSHEKLFTTTLNRMEAIDLEGSFGNYFKDPDGNFILDMHMSNGKLPFGYNSRVFLKEMKLGRFERFLSQRPSISFTPPSDYPKLLNNILSPLAPFEVPDVYMSCGCPSSANENAIKMAFLKHFFQLKGTDQITEQEMSSVMENKPPGAPKFKIVGFQGGYHGKFLGGTSASNDYRNFMSDRGVPSLNWPILDFPDIQHPYGDNMTQNRAEEARVLESYKKLLDNDIDKEIAGLIIEPIQVNGGIRYASPEFYKSLLDLCYEYNVTFICDETNTCGWATGTFFAHYHWVAEKSPHIVTFGGRTHIAGLFHKPEYRAKYPSEVASTWNGDPVKLLLFERMAHYVRKRDWLDTHNSTFTQSIRAELLHCQQKCKFPITNIRGAGKLFAFDVQSERVRNELVIEARKFGFKLNPIGKTTIGFTPSLLFAEFHFSFFKEWLLNFQPFSNILPF